MSKSTSIAKLQYVILNPRQAITLNLFEAEKYEAAIVVQQLIGNLVYYSNYGRYEPRLAQSWRRVNDVTWVFKLHPNMKCEDGEVINADSFKKSLERSLAIYSKLGGIPILSSLVGYADFVLANSKRSMDSIQPIAGISSDGNLELTFKFTKRIKSGLLQILSFGPFGYISYKNLNPDGSWKNNKLFVSSGPYKVQDIIIGEKYVVTKNPYWISFNEGAPDEIIITHHDRNLKSDEAVIVDSFTNEFSKPFFTAYNLVPEYLNSILLGNLEKGYFKDENLRRNFKTVFDSNVAAIIPKKFGINTRSNTFYPNQDTTALQASQAQIVDFPRPEKPIVIEGSIPFDSLAREFAWKALKNTLEQLQIPYKFAENVASFQAMTDKSYDIRIRGSSIGGGVEAWGLYVSFCSAVGINFPDPGNLVCKLIEKYEDNQLDDDSLSRDFFDTIKKQSAILPVSHYGVQLSITDKIDSSSFSPLLAIMKFDQIRIKD